jgi:hypothetical protein
LGFGNEEESAKLVSIENSIEKRIREIEERKTYVR